MPQENVERLRRSVEHFVGTGEPEWAVLGSTEPSAAATSEVASGAEESGAGALDGVAACWRVSPSATEVALAATLV